MINVIMSVREYQPVDQLAFQQLAYYTSAADLNIYSSPPISLQDIRKLDLNLPPTKDKIFILEEEGRVVGSVVVSKLNDQEANITQIALHPDYQSLSLGRKLLTKVLDYCYESGYDKVSAQEKLHHRYHIKLYAKCGFLFHKEENERVYMYLDLH